MVNNNSRLPYKKESPISTGAGRVQKRFFTQQFNRSCLPDGTKVGSICLSPRGDWRMPSDACYELWVNQLESIR